ncbi:MAG: SDR family NAD(P)-dependent oxidoreductase [Verrucomicrobiota bacterium]
MPSPALFQDRFRDQIALITGGAQGIGYAAAQRLAAEGASLWLLDHNMELAQQAAQSISESLSNTNQKIHALQADISNEKQVEESIRTVVSKSGKLDVMINCAGIVGPNNKRITDTPASGFRNVFDINLLGSFLMTKYSLKAMEPKDYGRILLVASIAGKEGNAGMVSYSSMKAGVIGLVKSVGKEFAETGITINGLAPAVIRTALVDTMEAAQVTYMTDKIPMKRCGTLAEAASIIGWITSPEASFNTGFTFDLSGGRAVY